jgi:putative transposase
MPDCASSTFTRLVCCCWALGRRCCVDRSYTAVTFGAACRANGITQSNSRKGTPHDNAAKESFFASLEKERLRQRTFATHEQARSSVFQYIDEFYNRRRLHSTLGYRSPDEVEREHLQGTAVAVAAAA